MGGTTIKFPIHRNGSERVGGRMRRKYLRDVQRAREVTDVTTVPAPLGDSGPPNVSGDDEEKLVILLTRQALVYPPRKMSDDEAEERVLMYVDFLAPRWPLDVIREALDEILRDESASDWFPSPGAIHRACRKVQARRSPRPEVQAPIAIEYKPPGRDLVMAGKFAALAAQIAKGPSHVDTSPGTIPRSSPFNETPTEVRARNRRVADALAARKPIPLPGA
jgi:hypothetical protein